MDEKEILQLNIERFRRMLAAEPDEARRATISRLLAEEEAKLRQFRRFGRRRE